MPKLNRRRAIHGARSAVYQQVADWPLLDWFELTYLASVAVGANTIERTRVQIRKLDRYCEAHHARVCRLADVDGGLLESAMHWYVERGDSAYTVRAIPKMILPVVRHAMDYHELPHRRLKVERPKGEKRGRRRAIHVSTLAGGAPAIDATPLPKPDCRTWLTPYKTQPLLDGPENAEYASIGEWPVRDFFERIYRRRNPRLAAGSIRSLEAYRVELRKLATWFEQTRGRVVTLADVDGGLLGEAVTYCLEQGNAIPTALKLPRCVLAVVRNAIDEHGLPPRKLKFHKPRPPKIEPRAWTQAEVEALLEAAATFRQTPYPAVMNGVRTADILTALLLFQLNTGVRLSAVMECPTSAYDRVRGIVTIPAAIQKQKQDQTFELWDSTIEFLERIKPPARGRLFDSWEFDRCGRPRCWKSIRRALKWVLCFAGFYDSPADVPREALFHKLRRVFATRVAAVAGIGEACKQLGHSSELVTARYIDRTQIPSRSVRDLIPQPSFTPRTVPPPVAPDSSPEDFHGI